MTFDLRVIFLIRISSGSITGEVGVDKSWGVIFSEKRCTFLMMENNSDSGIHLAVNSHFVLIGIFGLLADAAWHVVQSVYFTVI